jgi:hypothetical protein
MPYKLVKSGKGFKVGIRGRKKTFSKHPLSKSRAKAQLAAIEINTHGEALRVMRDVRRVLSEVPDISLDNKVPHANGAPLKNLSVKAVSENLVLLRESRPNGFMAQGFTLVYFMDSAQSAADIGSGKIPYLMVPRGTFHSGGNPITDIWKKRFQSPGTEHIIGMAEAHTTDEEIFIDMITVRNSHRRASIASKIIAFLKMHFPKAKLTTSSKTTDGEKFFKKTKVEEMTTCTASLAGVPAVVKVPQKPKSWIILGRKRRSQKRSSMYDPKVDRTSN